MYFGIEFPTDGGGGDVPRTGKSPDPSRAGTKYPVQEPLTSTFSQAFKFQFIPFHGDIDIREIIRLDDQLALTLTLEPTVHPMTSQWMIPPSHYIVEPCGIDMSEKLCLQWNDFHENIKSAFGNLRDDNDFADVTLACEDGQQVEAHKVILAASSPFFQKLLGRNKHPRPLIYMRGIKFDDLLAIVDFLYRGEANVFQENLDSFLAVAEELQLKGLMGKRDETIKD